MDTIKLAGGAGYYSATVGGHAIEVEYVETVYGDKGWFGWLDKENITDYPRKTRKAALAVIVATINAK